MARRYFNWKLAFVIVLGLVVLAVTAYGIRNWRRRHLAGQGLTNGTKAFEQGRWQQAAQGLGQYLARVPDDVPVLFKYAEAQLNIRPLKEGNIKQALRAYRDILRYDKGNHEAAVKLVEMYIQMNLAGEAKLVAEQNLSGKENPELRTLLAVAQLQLKNYSDAYAQLQNIIKAFPGQIFAYKIIGRLVREQPETFPDSSEEFWLDEAVKNNPNAAEAYIQRAAFYTRKQRVKQAREDLVKAQTLDMSDPVVRLRLAYELIQTDRIDEAKEHLARVQKAEPRNIILWQTWAQWAQKNQDKNQIANIAEEGLRILDNKQLDFMSTAIDLFIQSDRLDRALACIAQMRQQELASALLEYYEGLIAGKQKKNHKAVTHFRKALALVQSRPAVLQVALEIAKYRFALANAFRDSGDLLAAVLQLRTLVSENPQDIAARLILARTLLAMGNWENAAQQAMTVKERYPNSYAAVLLHLRSRIYGLLQQKNIPDPAVLQTMENELIALEKADLKNIEVPILKVQLAFLQQNFTDAEKILQSSKQKFPSSLRLTMLEVNALTLQNKIEPAVVRLRQSIEEFPQEVTPVRILATLLAGRNQQSESENLIRQALQRNTSPTAQFELTLLMADLYEQWNQSHQAYPLLNSLSQKQPMNIQAKQRLLRCKEVVTNTRLAQELVDQIKNIEGPEGRRWRCEQCRLWLRDKKFPEKYSQAVSILKENLSSYPDDLDSRMLLAAGYERAGKLSLALNTYRQAYERAPNNMGIIIPTVAALNRARQYDQAKEIINRTSRLELSHPALSREELQNYLVREQWEDGVSILEDLLKQDEENRQEYLLLLANLKMRNNQWEEAETLLNQLRKETPDSLPAANALVDLYLRQQKTDQALAICHSVVETVQSASAYLLRAQAYARLSQPDHALKDFSQAVASAPDNLAVWSAKSDFHSAQGQAIEAIEAIRKALTLAPNNVRIKIQAITLFLTSGDSKIQEEGKSLLDQAIQAYPKNPQLGMLKVQLLLAVATRPNIEQAVEILEQITQNYPEIADAWLLLGSIALQQGQPAKTIDYVMKGRVASPDHRQLLLLRADAEKETNPNDAIDTLLKLRKLYPDDIGIVLNLADKYCLATQANSAIQMLQTVLTSCQDKDKNNIRIALAAARYENGSHSKALQELDDLFKANPEDPMPLATQARLLARHKQWQAIKETYSQWYQSYSKGIDLLNFIAIDIAKEQDPDAQKTAREIFDFVLQNDPQNIFAIQSLALLLQKENEIAKAAALYDKVLILVPDNLIAINNYAWILCENNENYQKAMELASRGLEKAPNHLDLIDTRGMIYYRLGEYQHAAEDFQKCVQLYPISAPNLTGSHFHLGKTLAQLGKKEQALKHLNQALILQEKISGLSDKDIQELQQLRHSLIEGE